jgi:hypothetical protein
VQLRRPCVFCLIMSYSDEDFVLRTPHRKVYQPDDNICRMIADYLREIVPANRNTIKARLPENMPLWGKFRIAHGGDSVRTTMASSKKRTERNMSFVRVRDNFLPYTTFSTDGYGHSLNLLYSTSQRYCMAELKGSYNVSCPMTRFLGFFVVSCACSHISRHARPMAKTRLKN